MRCTSKLVEFFLILLIYVLHFSIVRRRPRGSFLFSHEAASLGWGVLMLIYGLSLWVRAALLLDIMACLLRVLKLSSNASLFMSGAHSSHNLRGLMPRSVSFAFVQVLNL